MMKSQWAVCAEYAGRIVKRQPIGVALLMACLFLASRSPTWALANMEINQVAVTPETILVNRTLASISVNWQNSDSASSSSSGRMCLRVQVFAGTLWWSDEKCTYSAYAPGQGSTWHFSPPVFPSQGEYAISATIDSKGDQIELDEADNTRNGFLNVLTPDNTPPPVPALISPAGGALLLDSTPNLDWSLVDDPDGNGVVYEVQVSTSSSFAQKVAVVAGHIAHQWDVSKVLDPGTYFWRVRAKDLLGNGWEWSDERMFTIQGSCRSISTPSSPYPASGAQLLQVPPNLGWGDSLGATTYDLFVDGVKLASNLPTSDWRPDITLSPGSHSWQVVAKNACGNSAVGPLWLIEILDTLDNCLEVFSTYGETDYSGAGFSWGFGWRGETNPARVLGMSFVTPQAGPLSFHSVTFSVFDHLFDWSLTEPVVLDLALRADLEGVPGEVLESFEFAGLPLTYQPPPTVALSFAQPVLQPGSRYWFTATAADPLNTAGGWRLNDQGITGEVGFLAGNGPWSVFTDELAAFRVLGCEAPEFKYVSLGDSFSSGEGADRDAAVEQRYKIDRNRDGDFEDQGENTDLREWPSGFVLPDQNLCHRSAQAFSQRAIRIPFAAQSFFACSGDISCHLFESACEEGRKATGALSEPPQLDQEPIDDQTQIVTLTLGGNDLHFADLITWCAKEPYCPSYMPGCTEIDEEGTCTEGDSSTVESLVSEWLASTVPTGVLAALTATSDAAPKAEKYLLGYPVLFPSDPVLQSCQALSDGPWTSSLSPAEQDYLNSLAPLLNSVLETAACEAGFHFVPVSRFFAGHEICGQEQSDFFNGFGTLNQGTAYNGIAEWFHPNADGQVHGYRAALEDFWTRYPPGSQASLAEVRAAPCDSSQLLSPIASASSTDSVRPTVDELRIIRYGSGCSTGSLAEGLEVDVEAGGFVPSTTVKFVLRADRPVSAGQFAADRSGIVATTLTMPSLSPGATEGLFFLEAHGMGANGESRIAYTAIELLQSGTADSDEDGIPDVCDNCRDVANPSQVDSNGDGSGDACDICIGSPGFDADGDGLCGVQDFCPNDPDNDFDGDGLCSGADGCPFNFNESHELGMSCMFVDGFESGGTNRWSLAPNP